MKPIIIENKNEWHSSVHYPVISKVTGLDANGNLVYTPVGFPDPTRFKIQIYITDKPGLFKVLDIPDYTKAFNSVTTRYMEVWDAGGSLIRRDFYDILELWNLARQRQKAADKEREDDEKRRSKMLIERLNV